MLIENNGSYKTRPGSKVKHLSPGQVRALTANWVRTVCTHNPQAVVQLYAPDGVLVGTVAQRIKQGRPDIKSYFDMFLAKPNLCGSFYGPDVVQTYPGYAIHSGTYLFSWTGTEVAARFTFVYCWTPEGWKIANHHSSALPE